MKKLFLSLLVALIATSGIGLAKEGNSLLSAFDGIPSRFQEGVLRISADNASPNPSRWYFVARNTQRRGLLANLTVADGQVLNESPTLNPRTLITGAAPINRQRIQVDSNAAFERAREFSSRRGQTLASVSFVMEQHGPDAAPIWSIWCYNRAGSYIGFLSILASTGAVVSSD